MVTVPALGPEWKAEELRGMSKKAKREDNIENLSRKWKKWTRGETGLCGSYFTRRFTAWFAFGLCVAYVCSSPVKSLFPDFAVASRSFSRSLFPEYLRSALTRPNLFLPLLIPSTRLSLPSSAGHQLTSHSPG